MRTHGVIAILFYAMLGLPAFAEPLLHQRVQACSEIADSLQRLSCYDAVAKADRIARAPSPGPTTPNREWELEPGGKALLELWRQEREIKRKLAELDDWQVEESKSPIDDSPIVILSRFSAATTDEDRLSDDRGVIYIRCMDNTTEVSVATRKYLGIEDSIKVEVRPDDRGAATQWWSPSTNYRAVFAPQPIKLIQVMLLTKRLVVRIHPEREAPLTMQFDLEGLATIIGKVQTACHW